VPDSAPSTRTRIEKLGVKAGHDVLVLGIENDPAFMKELRQKGAVVRTSGTAPADVIFATFRHRDDLRRLEALVPRLQPDGMLWTLRPKGSKDLSESGETATPALTLASAPGMEIIDARYERH